MSDNKLLTISIAAYNAGATLGRTLASVELEAEYMELLEIIVVDDGSRDDTKKIAEAFMAKHPDSVRVISKSNGGYGSTVNAAVSSAAGRYFKLLDGDDTFDAEALKVLLDHLRSSDTDLVITPYVTERILADGDESAVKSSLTDVHTDLQSVPVRLEDAKITDGIAMFEICVRTEVLRASDVKLTEHCFYTDNEFVMAAVLYSDNIEKLNAPVYHYRLGVPGQSMGIEGRRKHADDKLKAAYGVFDIYHDYLKSEGRERELTGSRKRLAELLISTMAREAYVTGMLMPDPAAYRPVLEGFDERLRSEMPDIYAITGQSRLTTSARKAGPAVYRLLCRKVLADELKRTGSSEDEKDNESFGLAIRISEYIAAACMIVQCRTVWMHLEHYGMIVNRLTWVVMMAALFVCIIAGRRRPEKKTYVTCSCMAVYALIFLIVNPVNPLRIIRCASAVIMMMALVLPPDGIRPAKNILLCYCNLMTVVAAVMLFGWIFGSTLHLLPGTDLLYMDWSQTGEYVRIPTFINIYYETQWTGWEIIPARNTGIFVEAPMAGFCCSLALLIELFVRDDHTSRKHIARIVILTVTIITTFSAISYVLLGILFLARGVQLISSEVSRKVQTAAVAAGLILTAFILWFLWNKVRWGSGIIRINDFVVGFHAWLAHPFFGGGFESLEYLQQFMPSWRDYDIGFSNSPMEILAQGGIYLGIPYVYSFVSALIRYARANNKRALGFVILFAYLFTFTVVPYQYITFFIIILLAADRLPVLQHKSTADER